MSSAGVLPEYALIRKRTPPTSMATLQRARNVGRMDLRSPRALGARGPVVYSHSFGVPAPGLYFQGFRGSPQHPSVMRIQLNGKEFESGPEDTVARLLERLELTSQAVAVAVNGQVVTRSRHAETVLKEHDVVEVIHAVAGG